MGNPPILQLSSILIGPYCKQPRAQHNFPKATLRSEQGCGGGGWGAWQGPRKERGAVGRWGGAAAEEEGKEPPEKGQSRSLTFFCPAGGRRLFVIAIGQSLQSRIE